jgi:hypothetical protein
MQISNPQFYHIRLFGYFPECRISFLVLVNQQFNKAELYQVIDPQFLKEGEPRNQSYTYPFSGGRKPDKPCPKVL